MWAPAGTSSTLNTQISLLQSTRISCKLSKHGHTPLGHSRESIYCSPSVLNSPKLVTTAPFCGLQAATVIQCEVSLLFLTHHHFELDFTRHLHITTGALAGPSPRLHSLNKTEFPFKYSCSSAPQARKSRFFASTWPPQGISRDHAKWAHPYAHIEKSAHFNQFSQ
jgi:hypothetical protein